MLLAVAVEVLRAANPAAPDTVTQQAYDDAREAVGQGATPRAFRLARRFGVSWSVFRTAALHEDNPARALAIASKQQRRRVLTRAEAAVALRRVADYLDRDELTVAAYGEGRVALNRRAAARHAHGRHIVPLPDANTIMRKFAWPDIAEAAGLRVPMAPTRSYLARDEAIVVFIETFGFMPRNLDIDWLGRQHGIGLTTVVKDPHGPAQHAAVERLRGMGRWSPPIKTNNLVRPADWQQLGDGVPALAALAQAYPRNRDTAAPHTLEKVRAVVAQACEAVPRGERLTVDRYRAMYKARGWPHYKTINDIARRHGTTFVKLVQDEAAARAKAP